MSNRKVPCGGFSFDKNFLGMNENGELSLVSGASEDKAYKYLVTDGQGTAKWEDRLAYETDPVETDVLSETAYNVELSGGYNLVDAGTSFVLKDRCKYIVTVDGETYNLVAQTDEYDNIWVGNFKFWGGEDTGEPFLAFTYEGQSGIIFETEGTHTVSIVGYVTNTVQIPKRYIASGVNRVKKIVSIGETTTGDIQNINVDDAILYGDTFYIVNGYVSWTSEVASVPVFDPGYCSNIYLKITGDFTDETATITNVSKIGFNSIYLSNSSTTYRITVDASGKLTAALIELQ